MAVHVVHAALVDQCGAILVLILVVGLAAPVSRRPVRVARGIERVAQDGHPVAFLEEVVDAQKCLLRVRPVGDGVLVLFQHFHEDLGRKRCIGYIYYSKFLE